MTSLLQLLDSCQQEPFVVGVWKTPYDKGAASALGSLFGWAAECLCSVGVLSVLQGRFAAAHRQYHLTDLYHLTD